MINRRFANSVIASGLLAALVPINSAAMAKKRHGDRTDRHELDEGRGTAPTANEVPNISALARSQRNLAAALIARQAKSGLHSFAISPMSVAEVLAIVAMGCDEPMRGSLKEALQIAPRYSSEIFKTILKDMIRVGDAKIKDGQSPLIAANMLVLDPTVKPAPAFLRELRAYGVDVSEDNLSDPKSVQSINAWVKRETNGMISSIIDKAPGTGGLVALNALYFKDRWKTSFDRKLTTLVPFKGIDGRTDPTQLMQREDRFLFNRKPGFVGVDLGFANERFSLVVATSSDMPASADILLKGTADWLTGDGFSMASGVIAIPHLDLITSANLLGSLQGLGMTNRPMTFFGAHPPTIASITQRNVLKLDETGVEAAAATAAIATRSVESVYVKMVADKPFLFSLRDKVTGLILVAGYVSRPDAPKA